MVPLYCHLHSVLLVLATLEVDEDVPALVCFGRTYSLTPRDTPDFMQWKSGVDHAVDLWI